MAVDAKILKQLRNPDPTLRRKAIVALADSRDLAALKPLEEVAQKDDDPKVRALAVKAKNHLKEQTERATYLADHPDEAAELTKPKVSEKDEARAKSYMEEAMSYTLGQDNAKAAQSCIKALRSNPNLKEDSYFLGLVAGIFNVSQDEAITTLLDGTKRDEFITHAKKDRVLKKKNDHKSQTEQVTWGSISFDLVIYGLVVTAATFLLPFVFLQLVGNAIQNQQVMAREKPALYAQEAVKFSQFDEVVKDMKAGGTIPLLIAAVIGGAANIAYMFALSGAIHVVATKMLGGVGTLRYLMSKWVSFMSLITGVIFVWTCIALALTTSAGMIGVICFAPMALATLVMFFKLTGKVGEAYDFGAGKGCLSTIMASVGLSIVTGAISYGIFGAALNAVISKLM